MPTANRRAGRFECVTIRAGRSASKPRAQRASAKDIARLKQIIAEAKASQPDYPAHWLPEVKAARRRNGRVIFG